MATYWLIATSPFAVPILWRINQIRSTWKVFTKSFLGDDAAVSWLSKAVRNRHRHASSECRVDGVESTTIQHRHDFDFHTGGASDEDACASWTRTGGSLT